MEQIENFLLKLYDAVLDEEIRAKYIQNLIDDGELRENENFIPIEKLKLSINIIKNEMRLNEMHQKEQEKLKQPIKKFMFVEDGSVDAKSLIFELSQTNPEIKVIVYRQGSNKPEILENNYDK